MAVETKRVTKEDPPPQFGRQSTFFKTWYIVPLFTSVNAIYMTALLLIALTMTTPSAGIRYTLCRYSKTKRTLLFFLSTVHGCDDPLLLFPLTPKSQPCVPNCQLYRGSKFNSIGGCTHINTRRPGLVSTVLRHFEGNPRLYWLIVERWPA